MMNSSSNQFRLYVVAFCVLTIVCVCQLGFWSFRGDLLQYQWVIIQLDVAWSDDDDYSTSINSNTSTSTSEGTSAPTSATTSERTTTSQTFTTEYDDNNDDGCKLTSHSKNVHWTTTNNKGEDNNVSSSAEQMHIRRVHQCATRFSFTYVEKPSDADWWPSLSCDITVTTELLQSVVQKHNRILFVGDSVLRQQYLFLLCMIDPTFERIQMKKQKDQFHYQSYYRRPDGGMTSLVFEAFGHAWPIAQRSTLYNSSFHTPLTHPPNTMPLG